eukprot:1149507-Amphidinium_carterae.1
MHDRDASTKLQCDDASILSIQASKRLGCAALTCLAECARQHKPACAHLEDYDAWCREAYVDKFTTVLAERLHFAWYIQRLKHGDGEEGCQERSGKLERTILDFPEECYPDTCKPTEEIMERQKPQGSIGDGVEALPSEEPAVPPPPSSDRNATMESSDHDKNTSGESTEHALRKPEQNATEAGSHQDQPPQNATDVGSHQDQPPQNDTLAGAPKTSTAITFESHEGEPRPENKSDSDTSAAVEQHMPEENDTLE